MALVNNGDPLAWPEIVSKAVHDMRTPLSSIRTTLEIFRMVAGGSEKQMMLVGVLDRQVDELNGLMETLLNDPAVFGTAPQHDH